MNNLFAAKYLQHLNKKKADNNEKGFTLIELLVVVIIIGVLAAVALPNLLGQVGKARESEAKNTIGALNRAQQIYYSENSSFAGAGSIALLEVPVTTGNYYSFSLVADGVQFADGLNNAGSGTRDYLGGVLYNTDNRTMTTALCRATDGPDYELVGTSGGADEPTAGVTSTANATAACNGDSTAVQ